MAATQSHIRSAVLLLSSLSFANAGALSPRALVVPTPPTGWAYQGCYTDIGRTIDAAGYASGTAMTNQACITFCAGKGFGFAGTEYHNECYCGSSLAAAATLVADTDCSTECSGDATQPCGGPNRLTIFKSSTITGPGPNPGVNGFGHQGCYTEGTTGRALPFGATVAGGAAGMTVAKCVTACDTAGYTMAGVEYGGECYCGNVISNGAQPATSGCTMTCNGNSTEYCGGGDRLNVYKKGAAAVTSAPAPTTTAPATTPIVTSATGPAPTATSQPASIGTYNFYGCWTESTGVRALGSKTTASDLMTLEMCANFCGTPFFGVEYARECYCGTAIQGDSVAVAGSQCNMPCMGNNFQFCGAGNRLSVYYNGTAPPQPSSTTAATTSAGPAPTGLPTGWSDQGCWIDGAQGRILINQQPDSQALTREKCAQACNAAGYTIAGMEYSVQCFCGNEIINGGTQTAATACNMPCSGNAAQTCGAGDRMSIISKGVPVVKGPPTPQLSGLSSWQYQGCYTDNINDVKTFFWKIEADDMTAKKCVDRCAAYGYMAAGIEYGKECYCGDPANIAAVGATKQPEAECNVPCAGNATGICGGGSRLTTYFWKGTPFYSWKFATGDGAGKYREIIGGVCIPLLTMEAINGKVSFLEKFGTGPPNSTGAYELDLGVQANPAKAWRPLHVKTDIFCSAGLTLPDKAGRQINIGGWSGDSTYGIRLFTPSGKAGGVWGTTDWQEDGNQLKLQAGRWYPSAMVMANGSVMVIGGEVGSNGAAVPSIEILPPTGTAPLYMEWLERTNPDNLYPFTAVLPSGGILVAYYNEARILDPKTFATIKTLPNMPGAVNNDLAGRTYPLEGTAVLLPQKAPYTDPLTILICGGSSNGGGYALDNCVSTQPDAANPKWTIERMPSFRVLTCMAALPDGTYLVLNGAKHGVAGFGLAINPNFNALLYDPSKPVGSRFTIMANTTIARMYHSEAITTLDGKVLITGSDPEDGVNPQEYRIETFSPPYILSGKPRPVITLATKDWAYGQSVTITLATALPAGATYSATLLGAVSSTHGNSMGQRTIMPAITCVAGGTTCTVTAPPNANISPPGWHQFFFLQNGMPALGVYVRIGGDPAQVGNWPPGSSFTRPGMGAYTG